MIDPDRYEWDKFLARPDSHSTVTELVLRMKWRPNEKILDYGCGPGAIANDVLLPVAVKTNSVVYGVDNSREMIEYAVLRYTGKYHDYQQIRDLPPGDSLEPLQSQFLSFHFGDLLTGSFPFDPSTTFDKIFCIFVFHTVKNYRAAIREMYRRLEPGGQLAFAMPSRIIFFQIYELLLTDPKWNLLFEKLPNYIPDWIDKENENPERLFRHIFVEETGFKLLESRMQRKEYTFDNLDEAAEFGLSITPLIKTVQVAALPELKKEYCQLLINNSPKYTAEYLEQGGPVRIDYDVLVMLLEKPGGATGKDAPKSVLGRDLLVYGQPGDKNFQKELENTKFAQDLVRQHGVLRETQSPSREVRISPVRDVIGGRSTSTSSSSPLRRYSPAKEIGRSSSRSPSPTKSMTTTDMGRAATPLKSILKGAAGRDSPFAHIQPSYSYRRSPSPQPPSPLAVPIPSPGTSMVTVEGSRSVSPAAGAWESEYKPSAELEAILNRARVAVSRGREDSPTPSGYRSSHSYGGRSSSRFSDGLSLLDSLRTDSSASPVPPSDGTTSVTTVTQTTRTGSVSPSLDGGRRYIRTKTIVTTTGTGTGVGGDSIDKTVARLGITLDDTNQDGGNVLKKYDSENRPPIPDFVQMYLARINNADDG